MSRFTSQFRRLPVVALSGWLLLTACASRREPEPEPELIRPTYAALAPQALYSHVAYLAADSLEGRRAGTAGESLAAEYIRDTFRHYGLEPAVPGYFQPFNFPDFVTLGDGNRLSYMTPNRLRSVNLRLNRDFRPLGISNSGQVSGPLVFAGYGIRSPEPEYNDYAEIDVTGKVLLILTETPAGSSAVSPFAGHRAPMKKALIARLRGAVAVLLVTGPADDPEDSLLPLTQEPNGLDAGLPVVHLTRRAADSLLAKEHLTIAQLQQEINRTRLPLSHAVVGVTVSLSTNLRQEEAGSQNVLATLPGAGALKEQWVVLGAHYDHLGLGGPGSDSAVPERRAVHNGADDNASGVAVMLEVAHYLADNPSPAEDRRSVMFQAFGAEEPGLHGSAYATANLPVPIESVVAMINLDMVGRMDTAGLYLGGTETSPVWRVLLPPLNHAGLPLRFSTPGAGASDHQSYQLRQVPALFCFTGRHEQYHHPDDDVHRLNLPGMQLVGQLVARVMARLIVLPEAPPFADEALTQ